MSNSDIRQGCPLPRSGVLLKALVDIAGLDSDGVRNNETLGDRSSRRVFLGDRVMEGSLKSLVGEIVRALVSSELLPFRQFEELLGKIKAADLNDKEVQLNKARCLNLNDPRLLKLAEVLALARQEPIDLESILSKKLLDLIGQHDAFASSLSTIPAPHPNAAWAALRLATVDLGMRYGAILLIEGRELPTETTPLWATKEGASQKLQALFDQCVPSIPRRFNKNSGDQNWSSLLGVSPSEVDRYLAKNDPPPMIVMKRMANVLAHRIQGRTEQDLLLELQRHYAACRLASAVAKHLDREKAEELFQMLQWTAVNSARFVRDSGVRAECIQQAAWFTLIDGCAISPSKYPLNFLAVSMLDPLWKGDIVAVRDGRIFERVVHYVGITKEFQTRSLVTPKIPDLVNIPIERLQEIWLRKILAADVTSHGTQEDDEAGEKTITAQLATLEGRLASAWQAGNTSAAEALLRKGIELQPENSGYHFSLGQLLMDRNAFQECKAELWLAFNLCNADERPYMDIAACLLKEGKSLEAIKHLENKPASLPKENSGPYAHWLGRAYLFAGRPKEALIHFEHAITAKQDLEISYDLAARAAFLIGDHAKGRLYAKNAKGLGCAATYDMWKAGHFKK